MSRSARVPPTAGVVAESRIVFRHAARAMCSRTRVPRLRVLSPPLGPPRPRQGRGAGGGQDREREQTSEQPHDPAAAACRRRRPRRQSSLKHPNRRRGFRFRLLRSASGPRSRRAHRAPIGLAPRGYGARATLHARRRRRRKSRRRGAQASGDTATDRTGRPCPRDPVPKSPSPAQWRARTTPAGVAGETWRQSAAMPRREGGSPRGRS